MKNLLNCLIFIFIFIFNLSACGGGSGGNSGARVVYGNGMEGVWTGGLGSSSIELIILPNDDGWMYEKKPASSYTMAGKVFTGLSDQDRIYRGSVSRTASNFVFSGLMYGRDSITRSWSFKIQGSYTPSGRLTGVFDDGTPITLDYNYSYVQLSSQSSLAGTYDAHFLFNDGPTGTIVNSTQIDGVRISSTGTSITPFDSCKVDGQLSQPNFNNNIYSFTGVFSSDVGCNNVRSKTLTGLAYRLFDAENGKIREIAIIESGLGFYVNMLSK